MGKIEIRKENRGRRFAVKGWRLEAGKKEDGRQMTEDGKEERR